MGARMAANLQASQYRLIVNDLRKEAAKPVLDAGAVWAATPKALAAEADVIFTSLPEPTDVEAVALGPDGLAAGIKPNAAYFDLSTNSPTMVKKIAAAFTEK